MSHGSRPTDLSYLASTMAANQQRVAAYTARLAECIDQLVHAATCRDWDAIRGLSQQLAADSRQAGYRAISAMADTLCQEAQRPDNEVGVKRGLIRLIGTYGRSGRPKSPVRSGRDPAAFSNP